VTWPVRTRICLECRAALSEGEHCTWVRHTAVAPADPAQRQRLVAAVWRSDAGTEPAIDLGGPLARLLRQLAPSVDGPASSPVLEVPSPPRFGEDAARRAPRGAGEEPLWTARTRYSGHVSQAAATAPSPVAGTPCVAYGLWLLDPRADGSPVLLRDGASLGFDVDLDDGQVARIPAGTADLIAPGVRLRRGDPGLRRYLRHLDAEAPQLRRPSPLPFREVREAVLAPGHQLSLLVELQPVPDARRPTASVYREPAAGVLAPVGRVVIRAGTGRPTDPGARGR
jgi:hypothetical protein